VRVSLVVTALNESAHAGRLIAAIAAQTRRPDEIVFVDGGSTDATLDVVTRAAAEAGLPLRTALRPGNISAGRNHGVSLASGEVVAVTDADCVPEPAWLERLVAPFADPAVVAVGGAYVPLAATAWAKVVAAYSWVPTRAGQRRFLPSHRSVAYRKTLWQALGGYDESLGTAEDTAFDLAVERAGGWRIAADAVVAWPPRATLGAAMRQQFRYGAGDGRAGIQLGYHAAVGAVCGLELALIAARGRARWTALGLWTLAAAPFAARYVEAFGPSARGLAGVAVALGALAPARLAGFLRGVSEARTRRP